MMLIKAVFRFAVDDDLISKDSTRRVRAPRGVINERKPLTLEEVSTLIRQAQNHKEGMLPLFLLFTGVRRGEALGAKWDDIADGVLHITRAVVFDSNESYISTPKTDAGVRNIPIDEFLLSLLGEGSTGYIFGGKSAAYIHHAPSQSRRG